ncbi:MAG TPA: aminodeoxychorismate synthase component I [Thiopseudomonas sp.]|nr:aminodeoxychorismate synthase component I [Thiopseudomonas sp.]
MPTCQLFPLDYHADPAHYFQQIHTQTGAVLLDSGYPVSQRGRFDILSAQPLQSITPQANEPVDLFRQRCQSLLTQLPLCQAPENIELPFTGGLIGYLTYELNTLAQCAEIEGLASATVGLYNWAVISDHQRQCCWLMCHPSVDSQHQQQLLTLFKSEPAANRIEPFVLRQRFQPRISAQRYRDDLQRVHHYIAAGDCYQVNYTQRFSSKYQGDAWQAYRSLRERCPTPFASFIRVNQQQAIVSLSPERFIQVRQRQVESRPIKGTRARGATAAEDQALADDLLASPKDRSENLMIVDLLRNDLGRYCSTGSIRVPELFALESYPNVHHMVSSVTGTLARQYNALDVLIGSFPGGSITGAPKRRAMQIITELEASVRSIYCGSIFYVDTRGEMDSSITIRTLLANHGEISCWGGGGIVYDSNIDDEYQESIQKVRVLMSTLEELYCAQQPKL